MNFECRFLFTVLLTFALTVPTCRATSNYEKDAYEGKNYIILNENRPFLEQLKAHKTIYVIKDNFNLNGQDFEMPNECVLVFEGGSLSNGRLIGKSTRVVAPLKRIFESDFKLQGNWNIDTYYPEWFGSGASKDDDDTKAICCALEYGAGKRVMFSVGKSYHVSRYIPVYSNTEIILNGTIMVSGTMNYGGCFEFFDRNVPQPGYNGVHDVYIHGTGTFDANAGNFVNSRQTPFRIHHCRDVRIDDITIKNYGMHHAIEIGGSENVVIKNVTFCGAIRNNDYGPSSTIQIENITKGGTNGAIPYDGTVSRDITISNCYFYPSSETGEWYTAIATLHGKLPNDNKYENITIKNCVFENIGKAYSYSNKSSVLYLDFDHKNVIIENNTFRDCAAGAIGGLADSQNVAITGNHFINQGGHIIWATGGKLSDIIIKDNFIDAPQCKAPIAGSDKNPKAIMFFQCPIDNLIVRNNYIEIYEDKEALVFHIPMVFKDDVKSTIKGNTVMGLNKLSEQYRTIYESNLNRFSRGN